MNILILCNKPPFPANDGGALATANLIESLYKAGNKLTVLYINTPKHYCKIDKLPVEVLQYAHYENVFINTSLNVFDAFSNLFTDKSYNVIRFYSNAFTSKLANILQKTEFDIVQLENTYTSIYIDVIKQYSKAKIVLRSHNIEHQIWERLTDETPFALKKWYLQLLTQRLYRFEVSMLANYDAIVPISNADYQWYYRNGFTKNMQTIPFGIDIDHYRLQSVKKQNINSTTPTFFFIGSLDWLPNLNGLKWFLQNVWHIVHQKYPDAKFYIAGRNMPTDFEQLKYPNVYMVGEVPKAIQFMQKHDIMICPLFSGGGMRVKIIEAMALGKTVISTQIGAENIDYTNNVNILIANNNTEFLHSISYCLNNTVHLQKIGDAAQSFVSLNYHLPSLAKQLHHFYQKLL